MVAGCAPGVRTITTRFLFHSTTCFTDSAHEAVHPGGAAQPHDDRFLLFGVYWPGGESEFLPAYLDHFRIVTRGGEIDHRRHSDQPDFAYSGEQNDTDHFVDSCVFHFLTRPLRLRFRV